MKYIHKLNGATYVAKKAVVGGVVFYAHGGNGDYKWMGATVFLSNEDIAKNLEASK